MSQDHPDPPVDDRDGRRQDWRIDGPRVLDVGGEGQRVAALRVTMVGGRVDVVTHDDSPTARVEVTSVTGLPVHVQWDGSTLSVSHGKDADQKVLEMIRRTVEGLSRNSAVLSISVPSATDTSVSTVGAAALLSGLRARVRVNTVSGEMTLNDLRGDLDVNTVSGEVEVADVTGPLKVNAVSGGVTVQRGDLPTARVNTVSGDITLDLTTGCCDLRSNSISGDVTVRAPLGGYDVEGNTAWGQVVVDGTTLTSARDHVGGRGGRLHNGDGALKIRASAASGSLVVLRAAPQDAASSSPKDAPAPTPHPQDHPRGWGGQA
ncbi:MAG: DUF4097 domain-containing protein [Actinomycetota bacterium]|nr:DUF4097 domain-containing protein [Actinomycetota bacterium]